MESEQIFSFLDFCPVMEKIDAPCWAILDRLADALGVAPNHFFMDQPPADPPASADECMRLWSEITTEEGRQQALQALRVIVKIDRK